MQHAGALVAIDGAEFGEAHRQLAVAVPAGLVDHDVPGAVHRLRAVRLAVDVHRRVHQVRVVLQVSGDLIELLVRDVRGEDEVVAAALVLVLPQRLDLVAQHAAVRMPEDQPRADLFVHRVDVELAPEPAMIALERLFDVLEVALQILGGRERGAVDALEHLVAFVAEPVGARHVGKLERVDRPGAREVRAAAEIEERTVAIGGDLRVRRDRREEVQLVLLPRGLEVLARFVTGGLGIHERLPRGDDLAHARLDALEILGSERLLAREVVVEAVLDRRSARHLDVGEQLGDRGGENVRGRMANPIQLFAARIMADVGPILGSGRHGHRSSSPRPQAHVRPSATPRGCVEPGGLRRGDGTRRGQSLRERRWWAILDLNQ